MQEAHECFHVSAFMVCSIENPTHLDEILPGGSLLDRVPEEVGGMIGTDQGNAAPHETPAPEPSQGGGSAQKGLRGAESQGTDDPRSNGLYLPEEKRRARIHLIGARRPVFGGPAFDDVADVDILAVEPEGLDHLVEELPGSPHERATQPILVESRSFAHKDQLGLGSAVTEDEVRPSRVKTASPAVSKVFSYFGKERFPTPAGRLILPRRWLRRHRRQSRPLSMEMPNAASLDACEQPAKPTQGLLQGEFLIRSMGCHFHDPESKGLGDKEP